MAKLFHPMLLLVAQATDKQLVKYVEYLKTENRKLRSKLPKRIYMEEWLAIHPGGQHLFAKSNGKPLEDRTARDAFGAVTDNSRWKVLRGYHVLRHSFASNLARHGVDDRVIRKLLGHESDEMTERYRHLFPEDKEAAVNLLSLQ